VETIVGIYTVIPTGNQIMEMVMIKKIIVSALVLVGLAVTASMAVPASADDCVCTKTACYCDNTGNPH
jgi:hypothetical protein